MNENVVKAKIPELVFVDDTNDEVVVVNMDDEYPKKGPLLELVSVGEHTSLPMPQCTSQLKLFCPTCNKPYKLKRFFTVHIANCGKQKAGKAIKNLLRDCQVKIETFKN